VPGWVIFKPNLYRTEPVPIGEVDWYWYWQGVSKPRSGFYRVDIVDLAMILAAYGSRGDVGIPPPEWQPGADILSIPESWCVIDLSDLVTILPNLGREFGSPPSDP